MTFGSRRIFWQRDDLIDTYNLTPELETVNAIRDDRRQWLQRDCWAEIRKQFADLPERSELPPLDIDLSGDAVSIAAPQPDGSALKVPIESSALERLRRAATTLHPWRKGPFRFFEIEIDAEWRSNLKWDRIAPALGDLAGQRILDVGCGNGYYMFRAAHQNPLLVLGLDPSVAFQFQFELVQKYARRPNLQYELLGAEHLALFPKTFDRTLCMGIIYHQRSPIDLLRNLLGTLRIGGKCLLESQTIPGDETNALFPDDRYAKARNVFFVPTARCLANWMRRAGFKDVEIVSHERVTPDEQRRTEWMRFESLGDFLDRDDRTRTVEGYPAPWRTAVIGTRMQ